MSDFWDFPAMGTDDLGELVFLTLALFFVDKFLFLTKKSPYFLPSKYVCLVRVEKAFRDTFSDSRI